MDAAHIIALLFLSIASIKDLRTRKGLKDKTFIAAIILVSASFLITQGPGTAGASLIQALLAIFIGIFIRLFTKMGGADIWTLGLIAATFPHTIILEVLAYTLIPLILWLKLYQLTGRKTAPAIPALTAGLLFALSIL